MDRQGVECDLQFPVLERPVVAGDDDVHFPGVFGQRQARGQQR